MLAIYALLPEMHLLVETSVKCSSSTTHFNSLTEVVYLYALHASYKQDVSTCKWLFYKRVHSTSRLWAEARESATRGRSWPVLGGSTGYGEGCLDFARCPRRDGCTGALSRAA